MSTRSSDSTVKTALVLGISGGVGGETARALIRRGWKIRALRRGGADDRFENGSVTWLRGDAMVQSDVVEAARGCQLIVHGVNPPKYRNWPGFALPMLDNTIAAAKQSGARILFPGTIYNFGPSAFPRLDESSPQEPQTRKGAIRVEMERRLRLAAKDGVRTTILRAGDFFGPRAGNSWFSQGLVRPGHPVKSVWNPARARVGHNWAYLPDVGETFARLADREPADDFEVFHFRGHWLEGDASMPAAICAVAGLPPSRIKPFPWWALRVLSPFVPLFREMLEMKYLWGVPIELDNRKLREALGAEPHTPLHEAVRETLMALGCSSDGGEAALGYREGTRRA